MPNSDRQYWLFQVKPHELDLAAVLRQDALATFPAIAHAQRIRPGDGVLLWQTGKQAACYGLAEVTAAASERTPEAEELPFWQAFTEAGPRVGLRVVANLWNRPLSWEALQILPAFNKFNGGRPRTNYRATAAQYNTVQELATAQDILEEGEIDYGEGPWLNPPVNQILYGPPGTGKTYQTIVQALSILENRPLEELELEPRKKLHDRFEQYLVNGQVAFVTFHQAFSYEDFVEGIKPVMRQGQLAYELRDGIFKLMARQARQALLCTLMEREPQAPMLADFNQLYGDFIEYLRSEQFHYFEGGSKQRFFLQRVLRFGNLDLRPEKSFSTHTVRKSTLQRLFNYYPQAGELDTRQQIAPLVGEGHADAYHAAFRELKKFENFHQQNHHSPGSEGGSDQHLELPEVTDEIVASCRRYVIIIDEINRGNLPAILGELITLIEADKREGRPEALSVILPYSQAYFSVPANLYLIGTMNTADRSAEPLDTALRRRFTLREMPPRPELIPLLSATPRPAGIDLQQLLSVINRRLSLLLDDEHRIGHTFLLDIVTLDDLRRRFEHQILPLLREYFFDDLRKIGLVLGSAFVRPYAQTSALADFDYPLPPEWSEGIAYSLRPLSEISEADFIKIYAG